MIMNFSVSPANEDERLERVRLMTMIDVMELRSRRLSGPECSKCGGNTIMIDLTPETSECTKCNYVEEI